MTTLGRNPAVGLSGRPRRATSVSSVSIFILALGALYCLIPIVWVLTASTKSPAQLFSTFTFAPSAHLFENIADLSNYDGGIYWQWTLNTALYSVVGALVATFISALSGYTLAKFQFRGKGAIFGVLLAGVLMPGVILAIPQYFVFAAAGLANTYWSVLLPQMITPYGIYLARIYASAAVPTEIIEAGRTEGASELFIFFRLAMPMMLPGLVTVFLFQFVAIWNNFMLPYIMLGNNNLFPLTVGLQTLLSSGVEGNVQYNLVITGALLSIVPLVALFIILQRFWRVDLASGAVKA
jgi:multiple sugar transport system permease protein